MNEKADKILTALGIPAKAQQQLSSCSIAIQQMVAIARAVDMDCKVLILDEPTSSLDEQEVEKLFGLMRDLREKGVGIIFVTHFLEQVYEDVYKRQQRSRQESCFLPTICITAL